MDWKKLWTELQDAQYAALSDADAAALINNPDQPRALAFLDGDTVFQATDSAEFAALTAHKQTLWVSFCGRDRIDPFASANVALTQFVFGAGSASVAALNTLRYEQVSRGELAGLPPVSAVDVAYARAGSWM